MKFKLLSKLTKIINTNNFIISSDIIRLYYRMMIIFIEIYIPPP